MRTTLQLLSSFKWREHSAFRRSTLLVTALICLSLPTMSAQINVFFNPVQPSCFGLPNGSITAVPVGGTGPYTYLWSTGQTTPTISGLTAGTYSVTVTGVIGTGNGSVTLTQPPLLTVDLQATTCNIPFTVTATGGGGVPPYSYNWSTGANGPVISVPPGTYCVTVTDQNNCGAVDCITINLTPLTVNVTATGVTCPNGSNGSVQANPAGGTPPYTYLWSNGATTQTQNNLPPGSYTVTLTDQNGCTAVATGIVGNKPPIVINVNATHPTCTGFTNGSIGVTASGGTPPFTYLWSTGQTGPFISNLGPGTYSVTVNDALGCPKTQSVTLITQSNLVVGALGTPETCPGFNNGFATANPSGGVQPYTYLWNTGGTTQVLTNRPPGTYTVTVTDAVGCTGTATAVVAAAQPFQINVTGTNMTTCGVSNGTATANIVTGTGPFTYLWSNGGTTSTVTGLAPGTYSVTVTSGNGCLATGSVTLTAPPNVSVNIMAPNLVCQGGTNGFAMAVVTGGTGPFNFLWNTLSTAQTLQNIGPGTYSVTVTDANGCTATATRTIQAAPAISVILSGTTVVCGEGNTGSATATVVGGTPSFTYLWSNGATTQSISGLVEGTYSVTVTDANQCTATGSININVVDDLDVTVNIQNVLCFGGSTGSATATGSGGTTPYTFLWSTGATTATISNRPAGSYTVTLTDANNCSVSQTIMIAQPTDLTVTINASALVCVGASTGTATAIPAGGTPAYTYLWNTGATTATISNLPAGGYSVTVTDANGCTETATVTINTAPQLVVTIESTEVVCGTEDEGIASVVVTGGTQPYTYLWSTGANSESIEDLGTGTYSVTVTDANGCTATGETDILVVSDFSISVIPRNVLCFGGNSGSILVTPTGGTAPYTYLWSNGQTVEEIINLTVGTYTVTVTEANGCTLTETITITQPPVLNLTVLGNNADCFGDESGSATATATGGTPPYTYNWSDSQTGPTAQGLEAGTYTVTVTDANFCTAQKTVVISQPAQLSVTVNTPLINCGGTNSGSATAIVTGGSGPYTYLWNTGATTSALTNIPAGTYSLTVTDNNGCTAIVQTITVSEIPELDLTFTVNDIICSNQNIGSITATVSGGTAPFTYLWSNGGTTATISNLAVGTYSLTVTDANGCVATGSDGVEQTPQLQVIPTAVNVTCFGLNNGSITIVVNGAVPTVTYLWSDGATTQNRTNLAPGTYSVTVTSGSGCTGTASATITQPPALTVQTTATPADCFGEESGAATASASGGTAPYTYAWSSGDSGAAVSGLPAGSYTVTATDANGCTATANVTVAQPTAVQVSTVQVTGTCEGSTTGSASASASGGTAPYTYAWSNGASGTNLSNLAGGSYTVTATDANGCTATSTVNITSFNRPVCSIEILQEVTDPALNDGQLRCLVSGGTGPFTFLWSNGATTATVTNFGIGTHTVTVTDANGCTTTCSVMLKGPARIGDFVWLDIDRDGIQDPGEIGIPNVMVILSGNTNDPYADTTFTNANGIYLFNVPPPGTYKVTFIPPAGTTLMLSPQNQGSNDALDSDADPVTFMTQFVFVTYGDEDLTLDAGFFPKCQNITNAGTIAADQYLCGPGGDPAPIVPVIPPSGGMGALEYLWMTSTIGGPFNDQLWQPIPGATGASYDPGPLQQTTYFIRCTRRECCTTYLETNIVTITVDDVAVAAIGGPQLVCVNQVATFTSTESGPTAVVSWTFGPGASIQSATGPSVQVHWVSFGNFQVTLTVTENGCTSTTTKNVTVTNLPTICGNGLALEAKVMDVGGQALVGLEWAIEEAVAQGLNFVVEHSGDGETFRSIGQVNQVARITSGMAFYEFMHHEPKNGLNWYRLFITDQAGNTRYSQVAEAVIIVDSKLVYLYPNPVSTELTVELFETFNEPVQIEVISSNGVVLHNTSAGPQDNRVVINFADYPAGAYFLRMRYGKADVKVIKVLKL